MDSELPYELLSTFLIGIILIVPTWAIYKKAGLSPWLSLLLFLPIVGVLGVIVILATSNWPNIEKES